MCLLLRVQCPNMHVQLLLDELPDKSISMLPVPGEQDVWELTVSLPLK
jgi:hypothetical protein